MRERITGAKPTDLVLIVCLVGSGCCFNPRGERSTDGGASGIEAHDGGVCFSSPTTYLVGTFPGPIVVGDFNGDGHLDLAVANAGETSSTGVTTSTVSVLLGTGSGSFAPQSSFTMSVGNSPVWPGETNEMAVGDFDGDGHLDIALATTAIPSNLIVLFGNGAGNFGPVSSFPAGDGAPNAVVISGDLDEDGRSDLVVLSAPAIGVLLAGGANTFGPPMFVTSGAVAMTAGDFNEDGHIDLAVVQDNDVLDDGGYTLGALLGSGKGSFSPPATTFAVGGGGYPAMVSGDFDGDGHLDVAVTNLEAGTMSVFLGTGTGSFTPRSTFGVGTNPSAVAVGDFNADGLLDLAVVNATRTVGTFDSADDTPGTVSLLLGTGRGTFEALTTFAGGNDPMGVAVADFNGDGRPDLAVTNTDDGTVSILLNCAN